MSAKPYSITQLSILVIIISLFAFLITGRYGHTDDYLFLVGFGFSDDALFKGISLMGRPLNAIISLLLFHQTAGMETLFAIRCLSAFTIILFYIYLSKTIKIFAEVREDSSLIAAFLILSPPFGVYLTWAATFPSVLSIWISLYAGSKILELSKSNSLRFHHKLYSGALLLVGLTIYQPGVFTFLLPFVLSNLASPSRYNFSLWRKAFIFLGIILCLYFVSLKSILHLAYYDTLAAGRSTIDLSQFFNWIEIVILSINRIFLNWSVFGGVLIKSITVILLLLVFFVGFNKKSKTRIITVVMASLLIAILPLAVTGNTMPFRTLPLPFFTILATAYIGWINVWNKYISKYKYSKLILYVPILLQSLAFLLVVNKGIVQPNQKDFQKHYDFIEENFEDTPSVLVYKLTPGIPLSSLPKSSEYGSASSWVDWVPTPMIELIFRDIFTPHEKVAPSISSFDNKLFLRVYPWQYVSILDPAILIDRKKILLNQNSPPPAAFQNFSWKNTGRDKVFIENLGWLSELNDRWLFSEDWGFIQYQDNDTYFHWIFGLCKIIEDNLYTNTSNHGFVRVNRSNPTVAYSIKSKESYIIEYTKFNSFRLKQIP